MPRKRVIMSRLNLACPWRLHRATLVMNVRDPRVSDVAHNLVILLDGEN
jgi:hypothetical protein